MSAHNQKARGDPAAQAADCHSDLSPCALKTVVSQGAAQGYSEHSARVSASTRGGSRQQERKLPRPLPTL